jgi:hypothetical protein
LRWCSERDRALPQTTRGLKYGILALVTSAQAGASVGQQALGSLGPFFAPAFNLNARSSA